MPVSADTLRLQLDYSAWASQRLMDAAAQLSDEELTRDFKTADKTVLDTLVHVYAADRIWLARVTAQPRATFIDPEDRDLTLLQSEWPALHERWKLWLRDFNDDDVLRVIEYKDTKGRPVFAAGMADPAAPGQSRDAPSRAGFRISARHGSHAAAAGFDRLLPDHRVARAAERPQQLLPETGGSAARRPSPKLMRLALGKVRGAEEEIEERQQAAVVLVQRLPIGRVACQR